MPSKEIAELPLIPSPEDEDTRLRAGAAGALERPLGARPGDTLLERFKLQRIIGQGGMGVVFAANDLQMQGAPPVAIKLLNEAMQAYPIADVALQRECRKVRMLANDAIVRVFEFYRANGQAFITMELLEGESLDVLIGRSSEGISFDDAWPIIRGAADALTYAHRQNPPFVHSDFKPSNVFLTNSGQVKVLDFGVARAARGADATVSGLSLFDPAKFGALTPAYATCEMLAGLDADPRDDVYALACVAYELLSGKHPFERRRADQARTLGLELKPIPRLGGRRNAALVSGLAFERSQRTPSIKQFIAELMPRDEQPQGDAVRPRPTLMRFGRTGTWLAVSALVVIGAGLWTWQRTRHEMPPKVSEPAVDSVDTSGIASSDARVLLQLLGVSAAALGGQSPPSRAEIRQVIASADRRVVLGSTRQQIDAALTLCREYVAGCQPGWYDDEAVRQTTLKPFELDISSVRVGEFRAFVNATGYRTTAEKEGMAYAVAGGNLVRVPGGSWRNAVNRGSPSENEAVVGVSFADAAAYCSERNERLPTEDEWEYVARGAERHLFPWGDDPAPATRFESHPPQATEGPAEGIGGRYRGLSGNVWQWVDTSVGARRVLKGGSWLDANLANRRAATRRYELPNRADATTGFRCARSVERWPDAQLWLSGIK